MTHRIDRRRTWLALTMGVLTLLGGALVLGPTSPANAAGQGISYFPDGPFGDGDSVTITATGFTPSAFVVVSQCGSGVINSSPGMCAPTQGNSAELVQANAIGTAIATIEVRVGELGNSIGGITTCGETNACDFNATKVGDASETASTPIPFALAPTSTPTVTVTETVTATPTATGTGPDPTLSFSPSGPFEDGDEVTVTVTGFTPNAPVAISECPAGRTVNGPGDCGRSADGASKLTTTDDDGTSVAVLTIRTGPLGNQTPPAANCGPAFACVFYAVNIAQASEADSRPIPYVGGGPALAFAPAGPFKAGAKVKITATGFTPNAPIAILQCGTRTPRGPGDCAPSSRGGQVLATADEQGVARGTLTILTGPLRNQTLPAISCGPTKSCRFYAVNISDASEMDFAAIPFAAGKARLTTTINLNDASVKAGTKVVFTGSVNPNQAGQRIYLQRKAGGTWVTKKSTILTSRSKYSISWTPVSTKDYAWRVHLPSTGYHYTGNSVAKVLRVR